MLNHVMSLQSQSRQVRYRYGAFKSGRNEKATIDQFTSAHPRLTRGFSRWKLHVFTQDVEVIFSMSFLWYLYGGKSPQLLYTPLGSHGRTIASLRTSSMLPRGSVQRACP